MNAGEGERGRSECKGWLGGQRSAEHSVPGFYKAHGRHAALVSLGHAHE